MDKVLTISVAAYNAEEWLDRCLQSFIIDDETLDALEVLVVNDGSKDKTEEIGNKYVKMYPETFKLINKLNGGHGSTINESIKRASGKYYKVVDADDWVNQEGLKKLISKLKIIDVDMVYTAGCNFFSNTGKKEYVYYNKQNIPYDTKIENRILDLDEAVNYIEISMHAITYKTEILKKSKYKIDENCFYVDMEYDIFYLLEVHKVILLNLPVYVYFIGREGQSISIEKRISQRKQFLTVFKSIMNFYILENAVLSKGAEKLIKQTLMTLVYIEYRLLMTIPCTEVSIVEIREFDQYLKNTSRIIYEDIENEWDSKFMKLFRLLRKYDFKGYGLIHKLVRKKLYRKGI